MSQYQNNIFLHNLRVGVEMVQKGMKPKVVSVAMEEEGIMMPEQLLAAAAVPGVMESMSSKPFTHKRKEQQIAAFHSMQKNLQRAVEHAEQTENSVINEID